MYNVYINRCKTSIHLQSTPKLLFADLWLFVWSWSNFHIILFGVPQFNVRSFKDAQNFLRCRKIKNATPYTFLICWCCGYMTLWCHSCFPAHLLDMNVMLIYSSFPRVLENGSWKRRKGGKWRNAAERSRMHHSAIPPFPGNGGMLFISRIFDFYYQKSLLGCSQGLSYPCT